MPKSTRSPWSTDIRWVREALISPSFLKWFLLSTLLLASTAQADRDQREKWTLNLYVENDLFSETDQDYTSGIRLTWVSPDISNYVDSEAMPGWVRRINRGLTFFHGSHKGLKRNVIVSIGQQIYTPQDLNQTMLIDDDRPYAGWLFMGFGFQTRTPEQLDTLELRIGVVGPAAFGREAQDFIHDLRGFDKFLGWDNQLRNEPGFVAVWEHKWKRTRGVTGSRFDMDAIGHAGLALGNVRSHLNTGAEFRAGWSIPDDFGTSAIRPGGENSTPDSVWDPRFTGNRKWGLHTFVSFDLRLVGQDIFLDGNTFKKSHEVTRESVVADVAIGISYIYGGARLSYAHIFRTREFSQQDHSHSYGSMAFSYTF